MLQRIRLLQRLHIRMLLQLSRVPALRVYITRTTQLVKFPVSKISKRNRLRSEYYKKKKDCQYRHAGSLFVTNTWENDTINRGTDTAEEKMSGLLLELRRQIAHNRRKAAYEERMRASATGKPQEVFSQKTKETSRTRNTARSTGKERLML